MNLRVAMCVALLGLAACVEEDECVDNRVTIALDEPSPWGATPSELVAHAEGPRVGTWTWLGGGDVLDVSPAGGEVSFSAQLILTGEDALLNEPIKRGNGRLACIGAIEVPATLEIQTQDGAVEEVIDVIAIVDQAAENVVSVIVDLEQVDWNGGMMVAAKDGGEIDGSALRFEVRWDTGSSGKIEGELHYAGHSFARCTGGVP